MRLHRAGEGAAFTGLKPAGLSEGPAITLAEEAVDTGTADKLLEFLSSTLRTQVERKLALVSTLKGHDPRNVDDAREYVEAMLGFIVNAHKLHECMLMEPQAAHSAHGAA